MTQYGKRIKTAEFLATGAVCKTRLHSDLLGAFQQRTLDSSKISVEVVLISACAVLKRGGVGVEVGGGGGSAKRIQETTLTPTSPVRDQLNRSPRLCADDLTG